MIRNVVSGWIQALAANFATVAKPSLNLHLN